MRIVVANGDTLVTLSEKYLDEPADWITVAEVNQLKDPNMIHPGQELLIPAYLLKGVPADGKVAFVMGEVVIRHSRETEWEPLEIDDQIPPDSWIRTGADGAVEITFEDGSSCMLKPESSLKVIRARKRSVHHFFMDFLLEMGRIITRLQKAVGGDSRFNIRTPSAIAAARGTEFRVSADRRRDTRVEVLDGTVDAASRGKAVTLSEGEGTLIRRGKKPLEPRKLLEPPSPVLLEETYNKMPLTFRFQPVTGAAGYRVMLASRADFKDVVRDIQIRSGESAEIKDLKDGSYFMQAQSIDDLKLEGPPSAPIPITVRTNPLPPFLQYPLNGTEHKATSVVFKWLNVEDAAMYHLQVSKDVDMAQLVEDHGNLRGTEFKTDKLGPDKYFFRVRSVASDGYRGAWSDIQSFTVLPPPPVPPADAPRSDGKHIYMRWQDLGEGMTYHFQMASDKEFGQIVHDVHVKEPEITLGKPNKSGTYYVRVSGIAPDGYEGNFSPPQSFKIRRFPCWLVGGAATVGVIILIVIL